MWYAYEIYIILLRDSLLTTFTFSRSVKEAKPFSNSVITTANALTTLNALVHYPALLLT